MSCGAPLSLSSLLLLLTIHPTSFHLYTYSVHSLPISSKSRSLHTQSLYTHYFDIHTIKIKITMIASILFALLPFVSAIVTPTTPDGSTVVNEGGELDVAWAADDTGSWTNVTIQLMTGDNFQVSRNAAARVVLLEYR